jgi:hypothetical protein
LDHATTVASILRATGKATADDLNIATLGIVTATAIVTVIATMTMLATMITTTTKFVFGH